MYNYFCLFGFRFCMSETFRKVFLYPSLDEVKDSPTIENGYLQTGLQKITVLPRGISNKHFIL